MTLRTEESREEKVCQAEYDLGGGGVRVTRRMAMPPTPPTTAMTMTNDDWARVMVPFDDFRMVRGPLLVPDGQKLDVSGGIQVQDGREYHGDREIPSGVIRAANTAHRLLQES